MSQLRKKRKANSSKSTNQLSDHLKSLPLQIIRHLEKEFQKVHEQYFLGKWEPSQLDAGRFSEMVLRVIEYHCRGTYTPIGEKINREKIIGEVAKRSNLEDSLRLTIPKLTGILLDFRNNRDVAHVGDIDVNAMDATFIIQAANWIMAELIRLESKLSPEKAQQIIEMIITRKVPLVEEFGKRLKCLNPRLTSREQILVFCYQRYSNYILDNDLFEWNKDKNRSRFRKTLKKLDKDSLVDYYQNKIKLTKAGVLWVEKNISFELKI